MLVGDAAGFFDPFTGEGVYKALRGAELAIGVAQAVALQPGVSRSGITITAARWLGFERERAARFSFLLSLPIIGGAGRTASNVPWHASQVSSPPLWPLVECGELDLRQLDGWVVPWMKQQFHCRDVAYAGAERPNEPLRHAVDVAVQRSFRRVE